MPHFHMCLYRTQFWQRSQLFNVLVGNDKDISVDPANSEHAVLKLVQNDQVGTER